MTNNQKPNLTEGKTFQFFLNTKTIRRNTHMTNQITKIIECPVCNKIAFEFSETSMNITQNCNHYVGMRFDKNSREYFSLVGESQKLHNELMLRDIQIDEFEKEGVKFKYTTLSTRYFDYIGRFTILVFTEDLDKFMDVVKDEYNRRVLINKGKNYKEVSKMSSNQISIVLENLRDFIEDMIIACGEPDENTKALLKFSQRNSISLYHVEEANKNLQDIKGIYRNVFSPDYETQQISPELTILSYLVKQRMEVAWNMY